ncbi:MAG: 2-oxo acid dehydrogenase subunit E2 [Actinobacteria bacterium]|nr:2-oxo acid dehydrogenase subunit E2 [Actinomycetota bacterium]
MVTELIMPELGTTTGDMQVLKVLKRIGDYVKLGEPILEVQTDKANVEVESYAEGYLKQIICKEGDMVASGTPIAILGDKDETVEEAKTASIPKEVATKERKEEIKEPMAINISTGISTGTSERIFATPLARKMARIAGIDITTIKGSGPAGRIVKEDVLAAIEAGKKAAIAVMPTAPSLKPTPAAAVQGTKPFIPPAIAPQEVTFVELSKMRRTIATRLTYSFKEIPHFYLTLSVNMENAVALKRRFEEKSKDRKFTYTDLLIKVVAKALREFPQVNSIYQEDKIAQLSQQNISLAISTDEGLITPTLIEPGSLNIIDISTYSKDVASKVRAGKLSLRELEPAAITISNLGMLGIEEFNAIINPPQSSILAVGAIANELKLRNNVVCEVPYMKLTLSVDHRIIDGVLAARFLNFIKDCLENPELLLL